MFAVIAGEDGCRSNEIAAMCAALPGRLSAPRNTWLDDNGEFGAAFRPLAILPEDSFESQPFVDADLVFVCRARLDDRRQLLEELQIEPKRGAALSDADIVRQCYRKWHTDTPQHLYGDFVFVAWERLSGRTVAATDPLGNYRLFHCRLGKRLVLATQLSALLACPTVHPRLDVGSLGLLAAGKASPGTTMFEGIGVLPGGEMLIFQDRELRTERWWQPDTVARELRSRDGVDEVRELFDKAVASRLRARGSVVAALSGGLDSALVTAVAAKHLGTQDKLLDAFTAADPDHAQWASAVAQFNPNIRHHLVPRDGMTPLDILPAAHSVSHTPMRHTADLVWAWQISALAAHNRARVVLCADHGNHSIGYAGELSDASFPDLWKVAGLAQQTWDRLLCIGALPNTDEAVTDRAAADRLAASARSEESQPMRRLRLGSQVLLQEFRTAHHAELLETSQPATPREQFVHGLMRPRQGARSDFLAQFGVEWRDPSADRRLLEQLLKFPLSAFRVSNRPRGLARELGRGLLPDSVRLRRAPRVATFDQSVWFPSRANDYRRALEAIRGSPACASFMDLSSLQSLVDSLCAGRGSIKQAAVAHQALDVGLFATAFESGLESLTRSQSQPLGMSRAGD
jgi:asparagine synthase (glutamine-hydrolysing)